ncbi:MAG: methyltransferase domain-containing protein [Chitinivibrionales bacterium]|nr:methyltransferase domain-containing protein [Chitinivibrionales bacterium]
MYGAFDENSELYEHWFTQNAAAYQSEVDAVGQCIPAKGCGFEIGVGTGRFSAPFGIRHGVEPSEPMRKIALKRGIHVVSGTGEELPYHDKEFDFALMVTTICFADDPLRCFKEAWRVLKNQGVMITGLVDKLSFLGRKYEEHKNGNVFYKDARFFSVYEVVNLMTKTGFGQFDFRQTIFGVPSQISAPEKAKPGFGKGAFIVVRGIKNSTGDAA